MFRSDDQVLSMLPGPCVLREPVLRELARQSEAYFLPYFDEQMVDPLLAKLKLVFQTANLLFVAAGGGRAGLETAIMSTVAPGERVVVIVSGVFGEMMEELVTWAGAEVTVYPMNPDEALDHERLRALLHRVRPVAVTMVHNETSTGSLHPIRDACALAHEVDAITIVDSVSSLGGIDCQTDTWGIDINVTASQKCLEGPVGIGIISVSDRAWRKIEAAPEPSRAWTHDLRSWKNRWMPLAAGGRNTHRGRHAPMALPSQLIGALHAGVELVLAEGLGARFARHATAGLALESGLRALGLVSIAGSNSSPTVKCVTLPDGVMPEALIDIMLRRHRVRIAGAFSRTTCVRVSAMGATAEVSPIISTLIALEDSLAQLGHVPSPGAGARAAEDVFRAALRASQ